MKRPDSKIIDRTAQNLFHQMIGADWVINNLQDDDYAKDFLVEIVKSEQLSGRNFYAQLKGTRTLPIKGNGKYVSFQLERHHAVYYADKFQYPVFLIVIDVDTKKRFMDRSDILISDSPIVGLTDRAMATARCSHVSYSVRHGHVEPQAWHPASDYNR